MILSVTVNPCVDHAMFVRSLALHDTNRVVRTEIDAGGKGINLSRVAAEVGGHSVATGFLGGGTGNFVLGVLKREGIEADFIHIDGETRTNFSIEDDSGNPPTTFNEPGAEVSPEIWENLKNHLEKYKNKASWLTIGGSLPPGMSPSAYRELVEIGHRLGAKVLLDADNDALSEGLKAGPDFIKPNKDEAERLLGRSITTDEEVLQAVRDLASELSPRAMTMISLGKDGAVLATPEGLFKGTSPQVEARSTIGSGDSLLGAFLAALERTQDVSESFRWGLAAGAATATTDGTEIARLDKIKDLMNLVKIQQIFDRTEPEKS